MPMTRRSLVKAGLIGAAALSAPKGALAAERTSVIVTGGGISGLYAALQLMDAGADVIVLEGSQRIGGRVFTADSVDIKPEYGASQIGASYARIVNLCDRLKLPLRPDNNGDALTMSSRIYGGWSRADKWESSPFNKMTGAERAVQPGYAGSLFMSKYNRLKSLTDWLDPAFADLDASLYDIMVKNGHSPEAIRLADLSGFGNDVQSSSMLSMMQEQTRTNFDRVYAGQRPDLPPVRKVVGGTSRMTDAMANLLGDRVRRGKIVTTIAMDGPKAEVVCMDASRYKADFVVAAIPFSLLRRVTITPAMPPLQAEAIHMLPSGYTSRGFGLINGNYWDQDGLDPSFFTDELVKMFWAYKPSPEDGLSRCTVVMTGAAAMRIDQLPENEALALVEKEIVRMRPSMAGKFKIHTWYGWGRNRLAEGCRHIFAPGQVRRFGEAMIQPHLRLHLAGEHTRRLDFGMESAAETGERAAIEILTRA